MLAKQHSRVVFKGSILDASWNSAYEYAHFVFNYNIFDLFLVNKV